MREDEMTDEMIFVERLIQMTFEERLIRALVARAVEAGLGRARLADDLGWKVEQVWEFEVVGGTHTVADVLSYAKVVLASA